MADQIIREHAVYLLQGGGAHASLSDVLSDVPAELQGKTEPQIPHSLWMLVDHMRICAWDIVEFTRDSSHVSPVFPDGYWPTQSSPPDEEAWNSSLASLKRHTVEMIEMVSDPSLDLLTPIPHGTGQTILREALLLADHNAYHLGQAVYLRRLLGDWDAEEKPATTDD